MHLCFKPSSMLLSTSSVHCKVQSILHISFFIWHSLHWLLICPHIQFKVCSLIQNCLAGSALYYLRAYCTSVSSLPSCSFHQPWATWLSHGCLLLWLGLGVLLGVCRALVHVDGIDCLSSLGHTFSLSFVQFYRCLETSLFISEDTGLGREHVWFKWRYINARLWSCRHLIKFLARPLCPELQYVAFLCSSWWEVFITWSNCINLYESRWMKDLL